MAFSRVTAIPCASPRLASALGPFLPGRVPAAGLGVRFLTGGYVPSGTSGRNTRGQVAQVLNTTGAYSLVQTSPATWGTFSSGWGSPWLSGSGGSALLIILIWWLYYERIMFAEEELPAGEVRGGLHGMGREGLRPLSHAAGNSTQPDLPFSWKTVIGKEYSGSFCHYLGFYALRNRRGILSSTAGPVLDRHVGGHLL